MATRNPNTGTAPTFVQVGENLKYAIHDGKIVVECELGYRGKTSASGKTICVASSRGAVPVGDGVYLSVNAYTYPEPKEDE